MRGGKCFCKLECKKPLQNRSENALFWKPVKEMTLFFLDLLECLPCPPPVFVWPRSIPQQSRSGLPLGFPKQSGLPLGFPKQSGLPLGFPKQSGLPLGFPRQHAWDTLKGFLWVQGLQKAWPPTTVRIICLVCRDGRTFLVSRSRLNKRTFVPITNVLAHSCKCLLSNLNSVLSRDFWSQLKIKST